MNAWLLLIVFLLLLAGFIILGRHYDRQTRRTEFQQAVERITRQFDELALMLGEQLTPVVRQVTDAFQEFAAVLNQGGNDG